MIKIAEITSIKNVSSYTPKLMTLSKSCIEKSSQHPEKPERAEVLDAVMIKHMEQSKK